MIDEFFLVDKKELNSTDRIQPSEEHGKQNMIKMGVLISHPSFSLSFNHLVNRV